MNVYCYIMICIYWCPQPASTLYFTYFWPIYTIEHKSNFPFKLHNNKELDYRSNHDLSVSSLFFSLSLSLRLSGWRIRWSSVMILSIVRSQTRESAPWRSVSLAALTEVCTPAEPRTHRERLLCPASWRSNVCIYRLVKDSYVFKILRARPVSSVYQSKMWIFMLTLQN